VTLCRNVCCFKKLFTNRALRIAIRYLKTGQKGLNVETITVHVLGSFLSNFHVKDKK